LSSWGDFLVNEIEGFRVEKGKVAIWSIGGCGFVIKTPKQIVYIDPYFGGSVPPETLRMIPVPFEPAMIRNADVVLCTHEHLDHCHKESLFPIHSNTQALFVAPSSAVKLELSWGFDKGRIHEVKPGDKVSLKDVDIHAVEGYDPLSEGAVMYVLQSGGITLFHSGDVWYFGGFAKVGDHWNIDVALINFGNNPPGKQLYLTPCDFLRAARDLRAKKAVPMHWDMWKHSYQDPIIIQEIAKKLFPTVEVHIMRLGDGLVYPT